MNAISTSIAIIGCGNLGQSIANGLIESELIKPDQLWATKRHVADIEFLKKQGVSVTSDNVEAVRQCDVIILAVKPYNMEPILTEISGAVSPGRHTVVSVATGCTLADIHSIVGENVAVIRAMPNTATDVRESLTCISYNSPPQQSVDVVEALFGSVGVCIRIDEHLMEAATVLGACGIAYVLRFIRAMIQGGIQIGFDARTATNIVNQTVKGAAELLIMRDQHPEHEIDKVTTPKGCTIVGLNEMEHNGFSSSLIKGIVASNEMIAK